MQSYTEWKNHVLSQTDYHGMEKYEYRALCFAEKVGVIEYTVIKNHMLFYSSFPLEHSTIRAIVNLDTMEESREYLKKYFVAYDKIIGHGLTANYCV